VLARLLGKGTVYLIYGEKGMVAQLRVHTPVNDLHLVLHGCLVM